MFSISMSNLPLNMSSIECSESLHEHSKVECLFTRKTYLTSLCVRINPANFRFENSTDRLRKAFVFYIDVKLIIKQTFSNVQRVFARTGMQQAVGLAHLCELPSAHRKPSSTRRILLVLENVSVHKPLGSSIRGGKRSIRIWCQEHTSNEYDFSHALGSARQVLVLSPTPSRSSPHPRRRSFPNELLTSSRRGAASKAFFLV